LALSGNAPISGTVQTGPLDVCADAADGPASHMAPTRPTAIRTHRSKMECDMTESDMVGLVGAPQGFFQ
jgi:hypothetical protein